jgi:hypothetical protein
LFILSRKNKKNTKAVVNGVVAQILDINEKLIFPRIAKYIVTMMIIYPRIIKAALKVTPKKQNLLKVYSLLYE